MSLSHSLCPTLLESVECQLKNLSCSEIITQLKNYYLLFVFAEEKLQQIMTDSRDQMSQGVLPSDQGSITW